MKQFETVTFKGTAVHTNGMMPQKGEMAPDFTAVAGDLSDLSLGSLKGKRVILNIFPSLDTSVCATSVRKFNVKAAHLENVQVLAVSMDLPFAQGRFCTTEGIESVKPVSLFRSKDFAGELRADDGGRSLGRIDGTGRNHCGRERKGDICPVGSGNNGRTGL